MELRSCRKSDLIRSESFQRKVGWRRQLQNLDQVKVVRSEEELANKAEATSCSSSSREIFISFKNLHLLQKSSSPSKIFISFENLHLLRKSSSPLKIFISFENPSEIFLFFENPPRQIFSLKIILIIIIKEF